METAADTYGNAQQLMLNLILGTMVFGLALDILPRDFWAVAKKPRAVLSGIGAQFLLLPAATFLVTLAVDLDPGIELGMMLVACCPGGAISNFITLLARGNVALSLSMTALSSLLAIVLLPANFAFWVSLNPDMSAFLQAIDVDVNSIFRTLLLVLALPLVLGQLVRHFAPRVANLLHNILKPVSVLVLFGFIFIAVAQNLEEFTKGFSTFFIIVVAHNALAFLLGWIAARLGRLNGRDTRAVSIEVGIQNSSLAIAIIYGEFAAEPSMLLIAAFWGTWHIAAGLIFAFASRMMRRNPNGLSENL